MNEDDGDNNNVFLPDALHCLTNNEKNAVHAPIFIDPSHLVDLTDATS